jgi:site-specific DNA-methyltransferase (adenine-specific)
VNQLHFGDNIDVLRNPKLIKDESVDLIYLDPPFNSKANYSVIFSDNSGEFSEAQTEAFKDTWSWGPSAAQAYDDIMKMRNELSALMESFRRWMGTNGMFAYLIMMTVRLVELHRVLKPTGSIYLHCDPTASHYLKIILDAVFGAENFVNEIVWQRTSSHNDPRRYGRIHDVILYYSKSGDRIWNPIYEAPDADFFDAHDFETDAEGRRFRKRDLTAPYRGGGSGQYEWKGKLPPRGRMWSYTKANMEKLEAEGRIVYTRTGTPRLKIYVEDLRGLPLQDVWAKPELWLNSAAQERLGYPTQKPIALLERIIKTSSREGDVVLDPFCGCGTTIEAAERLNRQWIGIDVTHYAVTLMETRLRNAHPDADYKVFGRPTDIAGARELADRDKYQFQWWAAWRLGAQTYETKKGGDRGIDGNIYFANGPYGLGRIIISVKGGTHVNPSMVRDLAGTVEREGAEMGILVTLGEPTRGMVADAANYGFVPKTPHGRIPRIQIVSAEDIVDGRKPNLPPLPAPDHHAHIRRKLHKDQLELMLPFAGAAGLRAEDGSMIDPSFVQLAAR